MVDRAALADQGSVEEITGIELQAGFLGPDVHLPSAVGIVKPGRLGQFAFLILVQDPVVVVTAAVGQLLELVVDAGTDRESLAEVHRGSFHGMRPESTGV